MSEENVEVARRVLLAFNRRDDATMRELVAPDARLEPILAGVEGTTYLGPEGFLEFTDQFNESFAEVRADYSQMEELGEAVLVTGTTTGRGRTGGVPIEQHWFLAIRLRQGRIIYAGLRRDRAVALEAAGLSE
jgi:ketosteroid isomerase-like protein